MSTIDEYRIIERDKFFIQKEKFGIWWYQRNKADYFETWFTPSAFPIAFIVAAIVFGSTKGLNYPLAMWFAIIAVLLSFAYWLNYFIRYKYTFNTFEQAKYFIDIEILREDAKKHNKERDKQEKIQNKIKRKNQKIHYLNIKTERKAKLNKIGL